MTKRLNDNEAVVLPDPNEPPKKKVRTKEADGTVSGEKLPGYSRNVNPFIDIMMAIKHEKSKAAVIENEDELEEKILKWYTDIGKNTELVNLLHEYFTMDEEDPGIVISSVGKIMDIILPTDPGPIPEKLVTPVLLNCFKSKIKWPRRYV